MGDTSCPKAQEIYDKTEFVLHDVEEGQKEQYLLQNSEKIAVVFSLISTAVQNLSGCLRISALAEIVILRSSLSPWQPEDVWS